MTFDDLTSLDPAAIRNLPRRNRAENIPDCTDCESCTGCDSCTSCRDCWGLKGGKNRQYVAFGEQLTADQWAQFLVKMKAPQPKRKNDDI